MSCSPSKCKDLTIKRRGNHDLYSPIGMIPSCKEVEILGVTFQCDSKFSVHVKNKLIKTNESLHILSTLRKEGYNQSEIDLLFNTIVLPNINGVKGFSVIRDGTQIFSVVCDRAQPR